MAVWDLREHLGSEQPDGYFERKQRELEDGLTFWRRTDFNSEAITIQFFSNHHMLGYLAVKHDDYRAEAPGKSAVAIAYEDDGVLAINAETSEPDRLASYYPVSPSKAAYALVQYCTERGKL